MAWTTPKTFVSGERLFAEDLNVYVSDNLADLDDRTVKVFADSSARSAAIPSPSEGQVTYLQDLDEVQFYTGSTWKAVGMSEPKSITATGGDEVYEIIEGNLVYKVHKYESSNDFIVSAADIDALVQVMLVAGGGGGGANDGSGGYYGGGGGGAGGLLTATASVSAATYPIVVGAGGSGGAAGYNDGTKGSDSTGFSLTAEGGGFGGAGANGNVGRNGGSGGSGGGHGGGNASNSSRAITTGSLGQGLGSLGVHRAGGPTGGAGAGGHAQRGHTQLPGPGVQSAFDGNLQTYCAGGAPGTRTAGANTVTYLNATADTIGGGGEGGGGSNASRAGQNGRAGVVLVRYPVRYV